MQAAQRPAVVHQVEFYVAAPTVELKFAMIRRKRGITMPGDNRQIRRKVVISYAAGKRKRVLKTPFTEVVEEKAADAS